MNTVARLSSFPTPFPTQSKSHPWVEIHRSGSSMWKLVSLASYWPLCRNRTCSVMNLMHFKNVLYSSRVLRQFAGFVGSLEDLMILDEGSETKFTSSGIKAAIEDLIHGTERFCKAMWNRNSMHIAASSGDPEGRHLHVCTARAISAMMRLYRFKNGTTITFSSYAAHVLVYLWTYNQHESYQRIDVALVSEVIFSHRSGLRGFFVELLTSCPGPYPQDFIERISRVLRDDTAASPRLRSRTVSSRSAAH